MRKIRNVSVVWLGALLLGSAVWAQEAPTSTWPPALPGVDGVVTLETDEFLVVPAAVTEAAQKPGAAPFVVAGTPPRVELAFHGPLPHDGNNHTGWSAWGDIAVADDGKVYCGIGDHGADAAGTANAYIFEWDPAASTLRQVVDVNKVGPREGGEPTWSKIHARIDQGADGWVYFTGTLNSGARAGQEQYKWTESLPGGQLLRYNPATGESEVFANLPPKRVTATSLLDRAHNVWWCLLEAGGGTALYALDLSTRQPILQTEDGAVTSNRNFMLAADGCVYFDGEGGIWRADPKTGAVSRTNSAFPNGGKMRASTRESKAGHIYVATHRPGALYRYTPAKDELTPLGPDFLTGDYTTVLVLSPDERFVYYLPGAHGQARSIGTPVVQYEIATGQRKVLAFLREPIERRYAYTPGGTYGVKISADGRTLYVNLNGHAGDGYRPARLKPNGFGLTSFVAIHIPEPELRGGTDEAR